MPERTGALGGETSRPGVASDPLATTSGIINDNAKRSVSVRINTSDYGRIRVAARRLRVREAEVFRYLLQVGLSRISPLLADELDAASFLRTLVELGPDLSLALDCSAREFVGLLQTFKHRALPTLTDEDLELVDLAGSHPHLVLSRLGVDPAASTADARAALLAYFNTRYLPGGSA